MLITLRYLYQTERNLQKWYEKIFAFHPIEELGMWTKTGPLFTGNDEQTVKIALFKDNRDDDGLINGIAFGTSDKKFVDFVNNVDALDLFSFQDAIPSDNVVDHDISFSIYFDDPDGNKLCAYSMTAE